MRPSLCPDFNFQSPYTKQMPGGELLFYSGSMDVLQAFKCLGALDEYLVSIKEWYFLYSTRGQSNGKQSRINGISHYIIYGGDVIKFQSASRTAKCFFGFEAKPILLRQKPKRKESSSSVLCSSSRPTKSSIADISNCFQGLYQSLCRFTECLSLHTSLHQKIDQTIKHDLIHIGPIWIYCVE